MTMIVPNKFPSIPSGKRIALIGEAPGADEEKAGQPFVGTSGRFLASLLSRAGIAKDACFFGNISQHRPEGNDFSLFSWNGLQVQHGLTKLKEDLELFKPNIIVLLGNVPLKAAKDCSNGHHGAKMRFKNAQWRGSLFMCDDPGSPFHGYKCISTHHPAFCLRDYWNTAFLQLDLRKAVDQSDSPLLQITKRTIIIPKTFSEAESVLKELITKGLLGNDIEGYWNNMSCLCFCRPTCGLVLPIRRRNGNSYWSLEDEVKLWRLTANTLEDPSVPKAFTNGIYDRWCYHYGYGIRVRGSLYDTMLQHWSLYSELAKDVEKKKGRKGMGLAIQASLYTDQPYYKGNSASQDDETFYRYNGTDGCVTCEIAEKLRDIFTDPNPKSGYFRAEELRIMWAQERFNEALLYPFLTLEMRGMRYDSAKAKERRVELREQLWIAQARLNTLTGFGFKWTNHQEIKDRIRNLMLVKKGDRPYKDYESIYPQVLGLLSTPSPSICTQGEIETLCEAGLNVDAPKQFIPYLYETLQLPTQYNENQEGEPVVTADYEALLKLSKICQETPNDPRLLIIQLAITIRALGTREQMLSISADRDERIRCGYNIVGSNTGRVTCYESPTGSGYNLQTIPNYTNKDEAPGGVLGDRDLFLADPEHWFFQCDLKGADGWTVAAYSAMLGDTTMLDDYRAGISPFEVLVLKMEGWPISNDRAELKAECELRVDKNGWPRFANKRVQHGACYLEGGLTISRNVLKDSEGKLSLSPTECNQLKAFFFRRYWGIQKWHNWVAGQIRTRPVLTAASGQVRQFFGRPDEILTKAVAFEPQANTTYATNLAMFRLWTDPANRYDSGSTIPLQSDVLVQPSIRLRIEPLHQVHDALCGQFRKTDTTWATPKIKQWFDNPLTIAGQQITIPYAGGYGKSWGDLEEGKL